MDVKKKKYIQRFRGEWLHDARFQGWLQHVVGDDTKAHCKTCGSTFKAHIKSIKGHFEGKKHKENISSSTSIDETSIIDSLLPKEQSRPLSTNPVQSPSISEQEDPQTMQKKDITEHTPSFVAEHLKYNITEDEYDITGKHIASKLRALSWDQRIYAERLICEVLFEAQLGNLNRDMQINYSK